jgi:hypothetical protein
MPELSKENASQIAVEFLKKQKGTDKVSVAIVETQDDCWVISGTTPIQFGEIEWPERFAVVVDSKGKIKSTDYKLL